jgi:hypothetical protein
MCRCHHVRVYVLIIVSFGASFSSRDGTNHSYHDDNNYLSIKNWEGLWSSSVALVRPGFPFFPIVWSWSLEEHGREFHVVSCLIFTREINPVLSCITVVLLVILVWSITIRFKLFVPWSTLSWTHCYLAKILLLILRFVYKYCWCWAVEYWHCC